MIKISFEESQRINGVENIPAVGVIAGVIGMVVGISVYLSSRVSYVNERIQFLLICISALIGYLYQKHHEGVITAEAKKTGRMYDLTPEVLTCLSRANVKIHIMYVGFLAVMMAMTWFGLYMYPKDHDLRGLIVGVGGPGIITMLIVILHPL
ncbi:hypothetical protein AALA13_18340 [Lachnospiraceae bacterium 50-23]|nr:hypothetical protein [Dorea sp.]